MPRGATHLASDSRSSALIWIKNRLSAPLDVFELSMVQVAEQAALDTWWRYPGADDPVPHPSPGGVATQERAPSTRQQRSL
jgi:hypothetical protein